jgi:DNA-binding protein HU-beta
MRKKDLVRAVARETGQKKSQAAANVDAVFTAIQRQLMNGNEVIIPGFGSFRVAARPARQGRNPWTGEAIEIPAHNSPLFRPSMLLRNAVAGGLHGDEGGENYGALLAAIAADPSEDDGGELYGALLAVIAADSDATRASFAVLAAELRASLYEDEDSDLIAATMDEITLDLSEVEYSDEIAAPMADAAAPPAEAEIGEAAAGVLHGDEGGEH